MTPTRRCRLMCLLAATLSKLRRPPSPEAASSRSVARKTAQAVRDEACGGALRSPPAGRTGLGAAHVVVVGWAGPARRGFERLSAVPPQISRRSGCCSAGAGSAGPVPVAAGRSGGQLGWSGSRARWAATFSRARATSSRLACRDHQCGEILSVPLIFCPERWHPGDWLPQPQIWLVTGRRADRSADSQKLPDANDEVGSRATKRSSAFRADMRSTERR